VHVHRLERDRAQRASRRAVTIVSVPMVGVVLIGFAAALVLAARH
jgi:hypothetical protein